jgi:hypothetical protein
MLPISTGRKVTERLISDERFGNYGNVYKGTRGFHWKTKGGARPNDWFLLHATANIIVRIYIRYEPGYLSYEAFKRGNLLF